MKYLTKHIATVVLTAAACFILAATGDSQVPPPMPAPTKPGAIVPHGPVKAPPALPGGTNERSLRVDPNVNISLCVTQGTLNINGWNRSEIRVFVKDGAKFGIKVLEQSKTNSPVWVMVSGVNADKGKSASECIWGDEIEIDVPINASINIKGQETRTTIDTVRKANVKTIGGDVEIRNASNGVTASTYEGDVTVEGSKGGMSLETTTGNILVFEAGPSDIGDIFRAKTNSGMISLQRLEHRQIEAGSISGSIAFDGRILSGGTYSLSTSNGSIRMTLPANTSANLWALYSYGSFDSEIPIEIVTENVEEGRVRRVSGLMGAGQATLKLTTNNGSIAIKKQ